MSSLNDVAKRLKDLDSIIKWILWDRVIPGTVNRESVQNIFTRTQGVRSDDVQIVCQGSHGIII
ncbi:MAG: hypothetical protein D8M62_03715 [Proteobacteria bacterium]|nr:hypothetical protein [Pseudomonadota bacterium]